MQFPFSGSLKRRKPHASSSESTACPRKNASNLDENGANRSVSSNAARALAAERKCLNDDAMRAVRLPKYEGWGGYAMFLPGNVQRFCEYWGRGI